MILFLCLFINDYKRSYSILSYSYASDVKLLITILKIKCVDVLPLWNKSKADSHDILIAGAATTKSDVQKLLLG